MVVLKIVCVFGEALFYDYDLKKCVLFIVSPSFPKFNLYKNYHYSLLDDLIPLPCFFLSTDALFSSCSILLVRFSIELFDLTYCDFISRVIAVWLLKILLSLYLILFHIFH